MKRHKKLEKTVSSYELNFRQVDDNIMSVVDDTKCDPFIKFMYEVSSGDFPQNTDGYTEPVSQDEFARMYYHQNKGSRNFDEEYKDGWIRRAQVTYPSLIRDMHFCYLMMDYNEENDVFDNIEYSIELDVKYGVDLLVEMNGEKYFVNLYVDSDKSNSYLDKKKDHRHPQHDATEVHLPISRTDSDKKTIKSSNGKDIWLYSQGHIDELISQIVTSQ